MGDKDGGDTATFTKGEAYALVQDGIQRETAAAQEQITVLMQERDDLATENDKLTARITAAETERDQAKADLETFKTETETRQTAEAKRSERVAKVREVAAALLTPKDDSDAAKQAVQAREDRIVAMDEDAFTAYVDELPAITGGSHSPAPTPGATPPRQTAAFQGGGGPSDKTEASAGSLLAFGRKVS